MNNVNDTHRIRGQTELIIDDQISIKYFGFSTPGLGENKKGWKIFCMDSSSGVVKKLYPIVNGEKEVGYELIWANRNTYTYS